MGLIYSPIQISAEKRKKLEPKIKDKMNQGGVIYYDNNVDYE